MRRYGLILLLCLGLLLTVACGAAVDARVVELQGDEPGSGQEVAASPTTVASDFEACPVTLPASAPFEPPEPYPPTYPYEGRTWFGTEALWTALPDDGRWDQLLHGDKVFWWRVGYTGEQEPQPALWMTARRLDDEGAVQQEPPATNAYHRDFEWAMLSGFTVPASGCWEITGHYGPSGEETLTFVVWVGQ